ncbi:MAG TPA: ATP-binding cassette domain-containing protein [Jiangellaceae bacterium]|nr:ATP-binding cassette domain-containing protein [Jiangellaceae bacterium]
MIVFEDVSVRYQGQHTAVLREVSLRVPEGELCLVVGQTGSGKSTLLRAVNGLVPHFTGGTLAGRVLVAGRDTRTHRPRDLADVVGVVGQDPRSGFVADVVEDELAFGMEWLGLAPDVMRRRVEETLDLLGLADVRRRSMSTLSSGQQQRVAIGAALTAHPVVLVLDEPTSALDPQAAEDVLAALQRLVHDLGTTVLLAEHRLERVVQYADRVLHLPGDGRVVDGRPGQIMATAPIVPPVVALGRLAGWQPLPLSVRDARRAAGDLRARLAHRTPLRAVAPASAYPPLARTSALVVRYGKTVALRGVDFSVRPGEIVALMGRNGAGKSSLLTALVGLVEPSGGSVSTGGLLPHQADPNEMVRAAGLVPQEPADLLYAESVAGECRDADIDAAAAAGTCRGLLARLAPEIDDATHPRDLSEGQRLCLAIAVVLTAAPPLLLLDEPTRGLDYAAKRRLTGILRGLVSAGSARAVVLATHDVELVAEAASRVVVVADGEVVADGPTADVVVGSPVFAPQVAKVLAPLPWLTVGEVEAALEAAS